MNNTSSSNKDLIWNLGADRRYPERTVGFLKRFENNLCLFSGTVRQLYSNYEIHPIAANQKAVALPNPRAFHDTFNHVSQDAIKPTGLFIAPSEAANDEQSRALNLVFKSSKTGKYKSLPLKEGLDKLKKQFENKGKFLPVIVNSDLRFNNNKQPVMHLHRIDTNALEGLSAFQKSDIARAIEDKLETLFELESA